MEDIIKYITELGIVGAPLLASGIIGTFLTQVSNYVVLSDGLSEREIKKDAKTKLIQNLMDSDELSYIEKMCICNNIKHIFKTQKNNQAIALASIQYLDKNKSSTVVDDDWLNYFFEHSKYTSDEGMQHVWAKILTQNFNESNSVPKSLISIISKISKEEAETFTSLMRFMVRDVDDNSINTILSFDYSNDYLKECGIHFNVLIDLDSCGLIKVATPTNFSTNQLNVQYCNRILHVESNNNLSTGDVLLTKNGEKLANILLDQTFDENDLEVILSVWKNNATINIEVIQ